MAHTDLKACLDAVSDVVVNRPTALREFDQIYMKVTDMLAQTRYAGKLFANRRVVFVGDGDAIALCVAHLYHNELLETGPESIMILDFDERIVKSVANFAAHHGVSDKVRAELYNVCDPVPVRLWQRYDAFYTNPPYGESNGGMSIEAFLRRATELTEPEAVGCVVIADSSNYSWCREVLRNTERFLLDNEWVISGLQPAFHRYHLEEAPTLTSCNIAVQRCPGERTSYSSQALDRLALMDFYGKANPLRVHYVRDLTDGGRFPTRDHRLEPLNQEDL